MSDPLANCINPGCALVTIQRWVKDGDGPMREFMAPALLHLSCGHVRPTNLRCDVGDEIPCTLCGPATMLELEMLPEPEWFPHLEGLSDLATPA